MQKRIVIFDEGVDKKGMVTSDCCTGGQGNMAR